MHVTSFIGIHLMHVTSFTGIHLMHVMSFIGIHLMHVTSFTGIQLMHVTSFIGIHLMHVTSFIVMHLMHVAKILWLWPVLFTLERCPLDIQIELLFSLVQLTNCNYFVCQVPQYYLVLDLVNWLINSVNCLLHWCWGSVAHSLIKVDLNVRRLYSHCVLLTSLQTSFFK